VPAVLADVPADVPAVPPHVAFLVPQHRVDVTAGAGLPQVAFLVNRGGPLDVTLRRAPGQAAWDAVQTVGGTSAPVPAAVGVGPGGIRGAAIVTVRDARDRVVRRAAVDLCPAHGAARLGPAGPAESTFPSDCVYHPFARGARIGLDTDYGVPVESDLVAGVPLRPGLHTIRIRVRRAVAAWLGMRERTATVRLRVLPDRARDDIQVAIGRLLRRAARGAGEPGHGRDPARVPRRVRRTPPPPGDVTPPADALPNLVALPAFGFEVTPDRGRDLLDFAATTWNAGPGPLVVEGYRRGAAPRMDAFQFIRREGRDVAVVPVGALDYDARDGHDHWHFRDFARYSLVRPDGSAVATSPKEAWCLAPTDQIDQLVPNAALRPGDPFLESACGEAEAVQVREVLEVGAGDTYGTGTPGQAIDITGVPNGEYLLRTEANPAGVLRETTRDDDVALRPLVLGGRPGHRTVAAPPIDGVDTEGRGRNGR
jgi:hypothetical protein